MLNRAVVNLKKENLTSGFKACGSVPQDMERVLKRLPSTRQESTGESDKSILDESCLQLLKENCGIGVTKQKRKRGRKITPGKRETSLETTKYSSKNKKGKATPSSTASCSYTKSVEDELENEEQIWVWGKCNAE